jgi:signal transduction histidine kinase/DNA-binding response OmpR family regulator/HAMP domain-containing protein
VFRLLGKITIATQLTLLVAVVAGLAIFVVSSAAEDRSQRLLLNRSDVSLADECLLRGHALREAVREITRQVRTDVARHADALREGPQARRDEALRAVLSPPAGAQGESDRACLHEACLVEVNGAAVRNVGPHAFRGALPADPTEHPLTSDEPSNPAAGDLWPLLTRELTAALVPGKVLYSRLLRARSREGSTDDQPYLLALACPVPPGDKTILPRALLLTVDFTRLVEGQARRLPRQLLFVHDETGRFVYHPDPKQIGKSGDPWEQLPAVELPAGEPQQPLRLAAKRLSDLAYWMVRRPLADALTGDKESCREVEEELLAIPGLRFSRLWEKVSTLILSAQDAQTLNRARERVDALERAKTGRKPTPWSKPIQCVTFVGQHLGRFPLDPDGTLPVGVLLAGSEEEMIAEVHPAMLELWYWWTLPVLLTSVGLALVAAYFLTRPMSRLTEASQRVAQGDYGVEPEILALGEVGELAGAFREMTTRIRTRERELREHLARLHTILVNAADGIITFDQTGRIEQANAAAEEMFGYRAGGLTGTKVHKLMKLPDHLQKPVAFSAVSALGSSQLPPGGTVTHLCNAVKTPGEEHRGLRRDGTTFWMEVTFSQVPLEDRRVIIGIFRDVTARKLAEERIREMNDELDARVQLRTAQLEDAKAKLELALEQAESASAAKDRFISVVSHELRTPLTSAMGYTELLLNPRATKLRENPAPTLQKVLTSCKHLLTLINDLLDVGRYTAGKPIDLAPTRFDLAAFLRGVQEMVAPLVKKNANTLEFNLAPDLGEVRNDETRLRQVLLNLLSNAAKFTEKGRVCLQVERQGSPGGDLLTFRVCDTGAGMTAEQVEKLFTPFYRVDNSTTRRQGGTGLGLTITKMICELMGGSIRVESAPGQGSTFVVEMPAEITQARRSAPGQQAAGEAWRAAAKGTVLVIDDDPTIRHMLETYLQQEGYRVVLAGSGAEGMRLAREYQPTCITLDVLMPEEDGWDVLGRLKNDPATRDIPVIMLTIMEERNRGFALGATEYVTKPIDWGRLGSILCRYQATGRDGQPILIVEDDALQRGYLREELTLAGWAVVEAANGAEALKTCEAQTPSLILLDLTMPIMDGFEFLDELRRREGGADIPVVVVTARELTDEDRRRLNRSVAQVLAKESLSKEQLLQRVAAQMLLAAGKPAG